MGQREENDGHPKTMVRAPLSLGERERAMKRERERERAVPSLPFLFDLATSYPPHAGALHSERERERERERESKRLQTIGPI
jgi:hypothetical protein